MHPLLNAIYLSSEKLAPLQVVKLAGWVVCLASIRGQNDTTLLFQDTVVALQSLAKYAAVSYVRNGDVTITVNSDKGFQHSFHVSEANRLVLQHATLPDTPGEYIVQATGEGCGYVQVSDGQTSPTNCDY